MSEAAMNTDRELWREAEGDYYANSIHVTKHGGIGINVGGYVYVKRLADWHALARGTETQRAETTKIGFVRSMMARFRRNAPNQGHN